MLKNWNLFSNCRYIIIKLMQKIKFYLLNNKVLTDISILIKD